MARRTESARALRKELEETLEEYNGALNHALDVLDDHYDRTNFLVSWREGDWDACREFGFKGPFPGVPRGSDQTKP